MRYHSKSVEIEAIEWTGENLKEVQAFMFPASPLDHGKEKESIGINAYTGPTTYGSSTALQFAAKGMYVVKINGTDRFLIRTKEEFDSLYEVFADPDESVNRLSMVNDKPELLIDAG